MRIKTNKMRLPIAFQPDLDKQEPNKDKLIKLFHKSAITLA